MANSVKASSNGYSKIKWPFQNSKNITSLATATIAFVVFQRFIEISYTFSMLLAGVSFFCVRAYQSRQNMALADERREPSQEKQEEFPPTNLTTARAFLPTLPKPILFPKGMYPVDPSISKIVPFLNTQSREEYLMRSFLAFNKQDIESIFKEEVPLRANLKQLLKELCKHFRVNLEDFKSLWRDLHGNDKQSFFERCNLFNRLAKGNFCGLFQ